MEIRVESTIGICEEFMAEKGGSPESVSIVISPLKVISPDESNIRITSGCNMWQACFNQKCHFSSAARKLPKIKKAGE
ncbi:MAG: hypothetical protein Q8O55_08810 [Dehalococcoidales bacterium]|nr:hypothetical protein [Dehalococcoidales bacterium]